MSDDNVQIKFGADVHELVNAQTGMRDVVAEMEAMEGASGSLANATKGAEEGMKGLSLSTAGARREIIVLGHEIMSGNFSRVPGSLMVLGERMGGVSLATMGLGAAVAAAGFVLYELAASAEHTAETINGINIAMDAMGKDTFDSSQLEKYIDELSKLHGINRTAAESIVNDFAKASDISREAMEKLIGITADYAAVTGTTAPKAAQDLVRMMEDPMKAAEKLSETYRGILTPAQYDQIQQYTAMGEKESAVGVLADALSERFHGLQEKGMTPLQEGTKILGNSFHWLGTQIANMLDFVTPLEKAVGDLSLAFRDNAKAQEDAKAAGDARAQMENENALNQVVLDGLKVRQKIGDSLDEEAKLKNELKTVSQGLTNAEILGETEQANELRQTINLIQQKIDKIEDAKAKQAAAAAHQVTAEEDTGISNQAKLEEQAHQLRVQQIEDEADKRQISVGEEYASLQAELAEEHNAQMQAYQERLALWEQGSKDYNRVLQEMRMADAKYELDKQKLTNDSDKKIEELNDKAAKQQQQVYDDAFKNIERSSDQMLNGFLTGTQTWQQGMIKMVDQLALKFIDFEVNRLIDGIKTEAGLTNAKIAGDNMQLASGEATAAAGKATIGANAKESVSSHAASAASAVYDDVAQIPYVGWILAPPAAAGAFAAVELFGDMIPLETGSMRVKEGAYHLHDDEAVLPKGQAEQFRKNAADAALGKGGESDIHNHFHINAMDSKDVGKFFEQHGSKIADQVSKSFRNGRRPSWA